MSWEILVRVALVLLFVINCFDKVRVGGVGDTQNKKFKFRNRLDCMSMSWRRRPGGTREALRVFLMTINVLMFFRVANHLRTLRPQGKRMWWPIPVPKRRQITPAHLASKGSECCYCNAQTSLNECVLCFSYCTWGPDCECVNPGANTTGIGHSADWPRPGQAKNMPFGIQRG